LLLEKLNEGYDAVLGQRVKRTITWSSAKIPSMLGNWLIRKVTGVHIMDMAARSGRCAVSWPTRFLFMGDAPLHPGAGQQSGARLVQIPVRHHPRTAGTPSIPVAHLSRLLDLITVKFLHSYLTRPMHIMGLAGCAPCSWVPLPCGHRVDEVVLRHIHDRNPSCF